MKNLLIIFLLVCCFNSFSQRRKTYSVAPLPSIEYVYQGKHTAGAWLGLAIKHVRWPHSFVIPNAGGAFFYTNKRTYFSPGASLELYHQLDKQGLPFGIYCRLGYTQYKVLGQSDRIISGDLGIGNFYVQIFAGYNFNLQQRELQQFAPFRIGIKLL